MLIETDKRGKSVNLLYSNEKFSGPFKSLYYRDDEYSWPSLALLDYALRRRFSFYDIAPAFENSTFLDYINSIGSPVKVQKTIDTIKSLNKTITEELGKDFKSVTVILLAMHLQLMLNQGLLRLSNMR